MATFIEQARSLSPQILLVHHLASKPITLHFEHGVLMNAAYFNAFTKQPERHVQIRLQGSVTIHLSPTEKWPGWCYLQMWDNPDQMYKCTCYESKRQGYCQHVHDLEKYESIIA